MSRVQPYRDLVAHGTRRDEDCGLPAEDLCGLLLQTVDRWVFSVDIVTYLSVGHSGIAWRVWAG